MPDHSSWPAELVEKGARALAQANTSIAWDVMPNRMRADFRHEAQAVLSALSGDLVPREEHEDENDRLRDALRRIDSLAARWSAPLRHEAGDWGEAAWGVVGTEASLIAHKALGGTVESARARLPEQPAQERGSVRAERDEARSQADALAEALEEAEKALREHAVTWIALSDRLDQPYPDDPRWSPWTRFAKRVLDRGDRARKHARSALALHRSSSSTETEG